MRPIRKAFQRWLSPQAANPEDAQREYMVNIILLGLAIPGFLFGLASLLLWLFQRGPWVGAVAGIGVQFFYVLAYWLNRRGDTRTATYITLAALVLVMLGGGLRVGLGHSVMVGYTMIVAIAGLLLGFQAALVFILICGGSYALVGWMQISGHLPGALSPEEVLLGDLAAIVMGLVSIAAILWVAESQLRQALRREQYLSAELRQTVNTLEDIVKQRTADLARRTAQLEAAATVARRAAEIHDVDTLLDETVHLISDRFGFYHAGIFLLDERGEYTVLQAASSEGGQRMLDRGHRLAVGKVGIVGTVAGTGQPRIALGVGADAVFFDNPDLPLTRSEMAVPLKVGERVIGVLDVQSEEPAAFTQEDVAVLQTMADQIALAIENARALEQMERTVRELERVYGEYTRRAWQTVRRSRRWVGHRYRRLFPEPAEELTEETRRALSEGRSVLQPFREEGDGRVISTLLAVPMKLRGQVVGALNVRFVTPEVPPEAVRMVEEIADRLALALENARLLEETRRHAERDRRIAEITARVRASMDPETVLRTAARELGSVLGVDRVLVQVGIPAMEMERRDGEG